MTGRVVQGPVTGSLQVKLTHHVWIKEGRNNILREKFNNDSKETYKQKQACIFSSGHQNINSHLA